LAPQELAGRIVIYTLLNYFTAVAPKNFGPELLVL
jgi:hypothetical protein